ncbi:uncharacterized protein LOC124890948 [Capsicum annuum]|uniref:uncharacterized protein LOC124890948 n=1 Tax=Capsicum annuum TaxID=4072 RepID=UPI001FB0E29F|nr:uncharacterized protein LOC124890948 [Capsicum annuum]
MVADLGEKQLEALISMLQRYERISIDPKDQEKTTFTCPYGTFAFKQMLFELCNALATFERCMMSILSDMIEDTLKEKCHFIVKEGIVLGHKIFTKGINIDRAKAEVIEKLPPSISVKEVKFNFDDDFLKAFECLRGKLVDAPIIAAPDWSKPLEIMYNASGVALGVSEEESNSNTSSSGSSPDEAKVVTSLPNPVGTKTKATNIESQTKEADVETETEDGNLIRMSDGN